MFSEFSPINSCKSSHLNFSFICLAELTAIFDLLLPTSVFLNKNCLLRLLISILSLSVTITLFEEYGEVAIPIKEKIFKNSHPRAPAPIINIFNFDN